ncbi:MAG: 3-deoxy-manno-octulosonate cytidylyltransferase [Candidatus Goldiibacteriota bacterium]
MNIIGIIPARSRSKRLPGKMLLKIKGRTLIEHVYRNALRSKRIKKLYVATDSSAIRKAIESAGGRVIMTPASCGSGTERVKEAVKTLRANINDIIVNIQGDEPLLEPALIDRAVNALLKDKQYDAATLACPIKDPKEIKDPDVVKVIVGRDSQAVYFSRAPVPFNRDGKKINGAYLKHIGLYVYRKEVIDKWKRLGSVYENIEKLEQLRIIENGYRMKVITGKSRSIGVDTEKDLRKVKKLIT